MIGWLQADEGTRNAMQPSDKVPIITDQQRIGCKISTKFQQVSRRSALHRAMLPLLCLSVVVVVDCWLLLLSLPLSHTHLYALLSALAPLLCTTASPFLCLPFTSSPLSLSLVCVLVMLRYVTFVFCGEEKLVPASHISTIDQARQWLAAAYWKNALPSSFVLKYLDDDGDLITIECTTDWNEMLRCCSNDLRVVVTNPQQQTPLLPLFDTAAMVPVGSVMAPITTVPSSSSSVASSSFTRSLVTMPSAASVSVASAVKFAAVTSLHNVGAVTLEVTANALQAVSASQALEIQQPAGSRFVQRWRIFSDLSSSASPAHLNAVWQSGLRMRLLEGNAFSSFASFGLPSPHFDVHSAQWNVEFDVNFVAPAAPGRYEAVWAVMSAAGAIVCRPLRLKLVVGATTGAAASLVDAFPGLPVGRSFSSFPGFPVAQAASLPQSVFPGLPVGRTFDVFPGLPVGQAFHTFPGLRPNSASSAGVSLLAAQQATSTTTATTIQPPQLPLYLQHPTRTVTVAPGERISCQWLLSNTLSHAWSDGIYATREAGRHSFGFVDKFLVPALPPASTTTIDFALVAPQYVWVLNLFPPPHPRSFEV
jgi:hypothetical protein